MVDAGVPPIALVDWEDGETLVAVADGASGLVRPEPPVPVEQLILRGVSAGVKLGGDGVIPVGAAAARVRIRLRHHGRRTGTGAGREDVTVVGVIERESGCQPVDRGWPEYALTDLDDRPLGKCATVDGLFNTPEPQPRPWRLLGAQPSGPLAVALDRPTTDQSHLNRYFPGSKRDHMITSRSAPWEFGDRRNLRRSPYVTSQGRHCIDARADRRFGRAKCVRRATG